MYNVKYHTSLVQEDEMGVIAPMDHQRVISKLNVGLGKLYYYDKLIRLEPLPETMLDEGRTSRYDGPPTPDLILYDKEADHIPVIIEICHTRGLKGDLQKVISLIEDFPYDIQEGVCLQLQNEKWLKYSKGEEGLVVESSFSGVLQLDLNQFLLA